MPINLQNIEWDDDGELAPDDIEWEDSKKPPLTINRIGGAVVEGAKDVARSTASGIAALLEQGLPEYARAGLEAVVPPLRAIPRSLPTEKLAQPVKELAVSEALKTAPEYEGKSSGWIEDFSRGAPQMVGQIGATLAAGPFAGMGMMGLQITGDTYENAVKQGKDPKNALAWGVANAIVQAPLEQIGVNKISKLWQPQKDLIKKLKEIGEAAGTEWLTEFLQQFPDSMANIFAANPDKTTIQNLSKFTDEFWTNVKEGAYQGTLTAPFALLGVGGMRKGKAQPTPEQIGPALLQKIQTDLSSGTLSLDEAMKLRSDPRVDQMGIGDDLNKIIVDYQAKQSLTRAVAAGPTPERAANVAEAVSALINRSAGEVEDMRGPLEEGGRSGAIPLTGEEQTVTRGPRYVPVSQRTPETRVVPSTEVPADQTPDMGPTNLQVLRGLLKGVPGRMVEKPVQEKPAITEAEQPAVSEQPSVNPEDVEWEEPTVKESLKVEPTPIPTKQEKGKPVVLYHSSPNKLKGRKPDYDAFFGDEDWAKSFEKEFGEHEYRIELPSDANIFDLDADTEQANKFKSQFGEQYDGKVDLFYSEEWADKEKILPEIKKLGYEGAKYKGEYLLTKGVIDRAKAVESKPAKQAQKAEKKPTEPVDLLKSIKSLQPVGQDRALVSISELRDKANMPPEAFNKALEELAQQGKVALHHHDFPSSLTPEKRSKLLKIGDTYYVGVVPKTEVKSEPVVEKSTIVEKKATAGRAWIGGQFRPITKARDISRGKHKGKVEVFAGGRRYVVEKDSVKEWPGTGEKAPVSEAERKVADGTEPGKAGNLLLRTTDGKEYESSDPIHAIALDTFGLKAENIEATGVVAKDGAVWTSRNLQKRLSVSEEQKKQAKAQKTKKGPYRPTAAKARDFREWVRLTGGVNPNDSSWKGELNGIRWKIATVHFKGKRYGKQVTKKVLADGMGWGLFNNKQTRGLDERTTDAIEAGWLPPGSTDKDFFEALKNNPKKKWTSVGSASWVDEQVAKEAEKWEQEEIDSELEDRHGTSDVARLEQQGFIEAKDKTESETEGTREGINDAIGNTEPTEEEIESLIQQAENEAPWLFEPLNEEFHLEPSESTPQEQAALRGEKKAELPKGEKIRAKIPEKKIQPGTSGKQTSLLGPSKGENLDLLEMEKYGLTPSRKVKLYRAVTPEELKEIQETGVIKSGLAFRATTDRKNAEFYASQRGEGATVIEFEADSDSVKQGVQGGDDTYYRIMKDVPFTPPAKETEGEVEDVSGERKEIKVNPDNLSQDVLSKMNKTLRLLGYDIRGADDVKMLLKRHDGLLVNPDWEMAYEKAVKGETVSTEVTDRGKTWVKAAKKYFGITYNIKEAGYILQDGSMLDFSGKKQGGPSNTRALDHREIGIAIEEELGDESATMHQFMVESGAIRMSFFGDDLNIDLTQIPTDRQLKIIGRILREGNGTAVIDVTNYRGGTLASTEIERTTPQKIKAFIQEAYDGKIKDISGEVERKAFPENNVNAIEPLGTSKPVPSFPNHPSVKAIEKHLDPMLKKLKGIPPVYVIENWGHLPGNIQKFYEEKGKKGVYAAVFVRYTNGKNAVYILADRMESLYKSGKSLWHELGHFALRKTLNETSPEYRSFLDDLYGSKFKLQIIDHAQKLYPEFNLNTPEGQRSAADEWWAKTVAEEDFAKGSPALRVMWDKFVAIVRKFLNSAHIRVSMTRAEIREMMRRSYREMEKAEGGVSGKVGQVAGASADTARQLAPTFYSQMQKVLEQKLPGAGTAEQFRKMLKSWSDKGEFKADEYKWSGLDDWLGELENKRWHWDQKTGKQVDDKITKQEVLDFVKSNEVQIKEVTKGRKNELPRGWVVERNTEDPEQTGEWQLTDEKGYQQWTGDTREEVLASYFRNQTEESGAKFSTYQLPGGSDYRELLLTLPGREDALVYPEPLDALPDGYEPIHDSHQRSGSQWAVTPPGQVSAAPWRGMRYATKDDAITGTIKLLNEERNEKAANEWRSRNESKVYRSSHWPETPNVLAHVRFNTRTGPNGERILFLEEVQADRDIAIRQVKNKMKAMAKKGEDTSSQQKEIDRLKSLMPMSGKEYELILKRMLRYAAENGFDTMAWTPGSVQAERYDLSKQVDSIDVVNDNDGTYTVNADKDGHVVLSEKEVTKEKLPGLIGKELAEKAIRDSKPGTTPTYSGLDLKVGGEGKSELYDTIIPAFLNKYAKKWGAKVGTTEIPKGGKQYYAVTREDQWIPFPTQEEAMEFASESRRGMFVDAKPVSVPVHSLPITDSMKESVLFQGQAFFQKLQPSDVNTKEFKAWFKDSVVTENGKAGGKPLVVYHGTSGTFDKFRIPAYFAVKPEDASTYAEKSGFFDNESNVVPAYLSLQKPADGDVVESVARKLGYSSDEILQSGQEAEDIFNELKKMGYDGVGPYYDQRADNGDIIDAYIAFKPTQIKSIFNRGTWDETVADISGEKVGEDNSNALKFSYKMRLTDRFSYAIEFNAPSKQVFRRELNRAYLEFKKHPKASKTIPPALQVNIPGTNDWISPNYPASNGELYIDNPFNTGEAIFEKIKKAEDRGIFFNESLKEIAGAIGFTPQEIKADKKSKFKIVPKQSRPSDIKDISGEKQSRTLDDLIEDLNKPDKSEVTAEVNKDSLDTFTKFMGFLKANKRGWRQQRPDTTWLDRIISVPLHHFEKVPSLNAMFQDGLKRTDDYYTLQDALLKRPDGQYSTTVSSDLQKKDKAAYQKYADYLNKKDMNADGHKVTRDKDADTYTVTYGKDTIGTFESEEQAWTAARADELKRMAEAGFSKEAIDAVGSFRFSTDNGFRILMKNIRDIITKFEQLGLPLPEVAIKDQDGETMKVDLKVALAKMGDIRGYYFPRIRRPGQYMLTAEKEGENPAMEFFDTKWFMARRQLQLERQGYKVQKDLSPRMPEDVFQMAGEVVAMQSMINQALDRMKTHGITLDDFGLKGEFRDKDFVITGPTTKKMNKVLKDKMGGRYYQAKDGEKEVWHFVNPGKTFEKRLATALAEEVDVIGEQMETLFAKTLAEQVANVIKGRGHRAHMVKRVNAVGKDVWIGYEKDPSLALAQYARGIAAGEAKKTMALNMVRHFTGTDVSWQEFKAEKADLGEKADYEDYMAMVEEKRINPTKQPNAFKEAKIFMEDMLRNQEHIDRLMGTIKGVAVLKYLAGRISAPLVNLTALATSAPAAISGYGNVGISKAMASLVKAGRLYSQYRLKKTWVSSDTAKLFEDIESKGWHKAQYNREALSVLESRLGKHWNNLIEYSMAMFGASEQLNRVSTIAGAYFAIKDEMRKTGKLFDHDEALNEAKKISDKAHGVYNKANIPMWARGGGIGGQIAKSFYIFKTFSHNYLLTMYDLGFNQKQAKSALYMAVSPMILAGTGALVGKQLITGIMKALGLGGDDPEEELYQWIYENAGEKAENIARFGIFGVPGVSLKGSLEIGIADIPTTVKDVLGAPGSLFADLYYGGKSIARGDVLKGIEKMSPNALGSMFRAYREGTEGLTTGTNAPLFYGKEQVVADTLDSIYRFLSFNPAKIASIREKQWKERQTEDKYRQMRTDLYAKFKRFYLKPSEKRDQAEYIDLLTEVKEYNERVKNSRIKGLPQITSKSIRTNINRAFKPSKKERLRETEEED